MTISQASANAPAPELLIATASSSRRSSNVTPVTTSSGAARSHYRLNPYDPDRPKVYVDSNSPFSSSSSDDDQASQFASLNTSLSSSFRHNPYSTETAKVFSSTTCHGLGSTSLSTSSTDRSEAGLSSSVDTYPSYNGLPAASPIATFQGPYPGHGTAQPLNSIHRDMAGTVPFCPYPQQAFQLPPPTKDKKEMTRMFLGQMPYHALDMQIAWVAYTFGGNTPIHHIKQIMKPDPKRGGIKMPTGCYHCYVDNAHVDTFLANLNNCVLIDDAGVWGAQVGSHEQVALLNYCRNLGSDSSRRPHNRPYRTVVAQVANAKKHSR